MWPLILSNNFLPRFTTERVLASCNTSDWLEAWRSLIIIKFSKEKAEEKNIAVKEGNAEEEDKIKSWKEMKFGDALHKTITSPKIFTDSSSFSKILRN